MRANSAIYLLLLTPAPAFAGGAAVSPTTGLLQIFGALVLVIGLMLVSAWLFKRVGPITSHNKVSVKIVGGINIGNRERIIVVEVADQCLVLGITAQQINTLSTMPKMESPVNEVTVPAPENQFSHWLKKTLEKRGVTQN